LPRFMSPTISRAVTGRIKGTIGSAGHDFFC
jgi:hypothetical protein